MTKTTLGGLEYFEGSIPPVPVRIPDGKGSFFRCDMTIRRGAPGEEGGITIKYVWWMDEDPRSEDPDRIHHSHPWKLSKFKILAGGYDEERVWIDEDGGIQSEIRTYQAGDVNIIEGHVFHRVFNVQKGTFTSHECTTTAEESEWGYMNKQTGKYTKAEKDPDFLKHLWEQNPHLRPKV